MGLAPITLEGAKAPGVFSFFFFGLRRPIALATPSPNIGSPERRCEKPWRLADVNKKKSQKNRCGKNNDFF